MIKSELGNKIGIKTFAFWPGTYETQRVETFRRPLT
jgi:hypothetical protein